MSIIANNDPRFDASLIIPDYKTIDCGVIMIDRKSPDIDYNKLKSIGIIGTVIEVGQMFTLPHIKAKEYKNPKLDEQVTKAKKAKFKFGLYADLGASSIAEAIEELRIFKIYIQKYTPTLGVWLQLNIHGSNISENDAIIQKYKTTLEGLGLKDKIGFYATRNQLKRISWSKWQESFYLWLIDPVNSISDIETILTPDFFML